MVIEAGFFHSRMPFLSLTWLKIGPNDLAFVQLRTNPQGSGWSRIHNSISHVQLGRSGDAKTARKAKRYGPTDGWTDGRTDGWTV